MLHIPKYSWKYTSLQLLPLTMRPPLKRMCHLLLACAKFSSFFPPAMSLLLGDELIILPSLTSNSLLPKWLLGRTPKFLDSKRMCFIFSFSSIQKMLSYTQIVRDPEGPLCWHSVRKWRGNLFSYFNYFQSTTVLVTCSLAINRIFQQRILPHVQSACWHHHIH